MSINKVILSALKEDIGRGDVTTRILFPKPVKIKAVIIAKEDGVVAGLGVAEEVFRAVERRVKGKGLRVTKKVRDGEKIKKDKIICVIKGDARAILTGERVALNFLSKLSGIATLTRKYVEKIKPYKTKILDTRKTTPGLRELEKYAVKCGGGVNHRMGLFDQVLIKDNHIVVFKRYCEATAGGRSNLLKKGIAEPVPSPLQRLLRSSLRDSLAMTGEESLFGPSRNDIPKGIKVEIEVENLREFKEALTAGPDVIMLDNMSVSDIKKAVVIRDRGQGPGARGQIGKILLEVSGGVTLDNIKAIARTGADMISIGALTHSAKAMDFSLEV